MKHNFYVLSFVLLFLLAGVGSAAAQQTVRVCTYNDYPLTFVDKSGQFQGMYIDILNAIARKEHWKIVYLSKDWNTCLQMLGNHSVDLLTGIAYTDQRAKSYLFNKDNVIVDWGEIYLPKNSSIESLVDLNGKRIATVQQGILLDEFRSLMSRFGLKAKFVIEPSPQKVFEALDKNEVDAGTALRLYGLQNQYKYHIKSSPIVFAPLQLRFAAPLGSNPSILNTIDSNLTTMKADEGSAYYQSLDRWLQSPSGAWQLPIWLWWLIGGTGGLALLFVGVSLLLRWQVRRKTIDLNERNEQLNWEISERKEAEEALRKSEQLLQSLADNYPAFLVIFEKDFSIEFTSGKEFQQNQLDPKDFYGLKVQDVFGEQGDFVKEQLEKAFRGENVTFELEMGNQNLLMSAVPLPIETEAIDRVMVVAADITERKQNERRNRESLREKETLLQEIHHRVKNNLQVISSLLRLQSNSIDDEQIKEALKDSQGRIYAMSAVHQTLYESENLSKIDLKRYLTKISRALYRTYLADPGKIKLTIDIDEFAIDIEQTSQLGLIANELMSNCLKYAFPGEDQDGEIRLMVKALPESTVRLTISDNGIGIPETVDWRHPATLGLQLVSTLVASQLHGSIEQESRPGTTFNITFHLNGTSREN